MINAGESVLFNAKVDEADQLDRSIRAALLRSADALLKAYGVPSTDLEKGITTKTNPMAGFAKYVKLGTLARKDLLGQHFVRNAHEIYISSEVRDKKIMKSKFDIFVGVSSDPDLDLRYKTTFASSVRAGLGLFLLSLHCNKVITLPRHFNWPISASGGGGAILASQYVCADSELLSFVRSVNTNKGGTNDSVFFSTGLKAYDLKRYSTYATKLLLSTGWHSPADVNFQDLVNIRIALDRAPTSVATMIKSVQRHLVGTILNRFGPRCIALNRVEEDSTDRAVSMRTVKSASISKHVTFQSQSILCELLDYDSDAMIKRLCSVRPGLALPKNIKRLRHVPELPIDITIVAQLWTELQELYIRKTQRESYKEMLRAFGMFNLYLFFYLPHWFRHHPDSTLAFPDTPNKLIGGVFISRLLQSKTETPVTFVEFMDMRADLAKWGNEHKYACLKQLEKFFSFIHNRNDSLANCDKFRQPLSSFDYPPIYRSGSTKKQAFPQKIFGVFVSYIEAVKGYIDVVIGKVLEGAINSDHLAKILVLGNYCVDTHSESVISLVGSSPKIVFNGHEIAIRYLPYFPEPGKYKLKSGPIVSLPRPHAINQILLSQYTGLRHNHLQWLDSDGFDALVQSGDAEYTRLYVNTDKVKKKAWAANVNFRVIEICRDQRAWRSSIDCDSFELKHFYNGNPRTVYPRFRPLFSYDVENGLPHSDTTYENAWKSLILGFQTWAREHLPVDMRSQLDLCSLIRSEARVRHFVPSNLDIQSSEQDRPRGQQSKLRISTIYTPHTTRVSVVSYAVHYLPLWLIGKHITGQSLATVAYYVHPHPEDIRQSETHQAAEIQRSAMESHVSNFMKDDERATAVSIKASAFNSNLAKSMRTDIAETIVRYGCMSVAISEESETGLDVLAQVGVGNAAYNLTEICPYNNTCPSKIVKLLGGIRRCALCPIAVRSIDHLPAIVAAKRRSFELLSDIEKRIDLWERDKSYTDDELDDMEQQRQRVGEEFAGWNLCEAVLEAARARMQAGDDNRGWVIERPEILKMELRRVELDGNDTLHLLARLAECVSYPGFSSPQMGRVFDMCRRRVLAASGDFKKAFDLDIPIDAASECAGLLRSLVLAKGLTVEDVVSALETDRHLSLLPKDRHILLLAEG